MHMLSIGVCTMHFSSFTVGDELEGNGNGMLIVTPSVSYRSSKLLAQWLLQRLKMAGVKENQSQSIIWLTPCQGQSIHLLKTYKHM